MIIDLSQVTFTNDFFTFTLPDNNTLYLNKIDESFLTTDNEQVELNTINVQVTFSDTEKGYISCPCIIGVNNDILKLDTKYPEYKGKRLTAENMKYCTLEYYE